MGFIALLVVPLLLGLWAQSRVHSAYGRYSQVQTRRRVHGYEAAEAVMRTAGISDVKIVEISGVLTDHYDPVNKRLALSRDVYRGTSIAAIGIAAHEAGHAIQHKVGYSMLQFRMSLVPITKIASGLLPLIILGGFFFQIFDLIWLGVGAYLVLTVFQLVTLPVEFDASSRAKRILASEALVDREESAGVASVLDAAAWTYVAAFIASLATLLRLLMIARSSDD